MHQKCEWFILTTGSRVISNLNKFLGEWFKNLNKCQQISNKLELVLEEKNLVAMKIKTRRS